MNLFLKRYETLSIPLYKYYSNLEYAKDVIENSRIHFESPKTYNDIYDSTTYITDDQILNQYHKVEDIKEILESIGKITGESVSEEIIKDIFSKFCLGK